MKKVLIAALSIVLLSTSVLLIGCSNKTNNKSTSNNSSTVEDSSTDDSSTNNTATTETTDTAKTFTLDELKKYDGQNGIAAYVAVDGIVYDVTNADRWKDGKHESGVVAGGDLTDVLANSPHGDKVLKDLPVVGTLE